MEGRRRAHEGREAWKHGRKDDKKGGRIVRSIEGRKCCKKEVLNKMKECGETEKA